VILKPQLLPKKQLRGYITPFFALYYVLKKKIAVFCKIILFTILDYATFYSRKGIFSCFNYFFSHSS